MRFCITPGQASDITAAPGLLEDQQAVAVLADKAYNSNGLRDRIAAMKAAAVIPSKRNRKVVIPHDTAIYRHRNQFERGFGRLKHFRRCAKRVSGPPPQPSMPAVRQAIVDRFARAPPMRCPHCNERFTPPALTNLPK